MLAFVHCSSFGRDGLFGGFDNDIKDIYRIRNPESCYLLVTAVTGSDDERLGSLIGIGRDHCQLYLIRKTVLLEKQIPADDPSLEYA